MTNDKKTRFGRIVKVAVWAVAALVGGMLGSVAIAGIPSGAIPTNDTLIYTGELADAEGLIDGPVSGLTVAFYDQASDGGQLCEATLSSPNLSEGKFTVALPDDCEDAIINRGVTGDPTFVEVSVQREADDAWVTFSRSRIGAVPYAVSSAYAGASRNFTVEDSFDLTAGQDLDCEYMDIQSRTMACEGWDDEYNPGQVMCLRRFSDGLECPDDRPIMRGWTYGHTGNTLILRYNCCALKTAD